nr:hypothetical protein Itr_chr12CG23040 [Ipomoea trifida]
MMSRGGPPFNKRITQNKGWPEVMIRVGLLVRIKSRAPQTSLLARPRDITIRVRPPPSPPRTPRHNRRIPLSIPRIPVTRRRARRRPNLLRAHKSSSIKRSKREQYLLRPIQICLNRRGRGWSPLAALWNRRELTRRVRERALSPACLPQNSKTITRGHRF